MLEERQIEEGCGQILHGYKRFVSGMGKTARRGRFNGRSSQRPVNAQSILSQRYSPTLLKCWQAIISALGLNFE